MLGTQRRFHCLKRGSNDLDAIPIVLIAGLTNGKVMLDYFLGNRFFDVKLVITKPDDVNLPRHVNFPDDPRIEKSGSAERLYDRILRASPEFIFVAGWSEILSSKLLSIPPGGVIGFHPSVLPLDRGRSVLAWQISEGYESSGLTLFYYDGTPDHGDIIGVERFGIEENDTISDVLDKVDDATENLLKSYAPLLRLGIAPRHPQDHSLATWRRLRVEQDSFINWDRNSSTIYNHIRAISHPYPGAKFILEGEVKTLCRSQLALDIPFGCEQPPGTLLAKLYDGSLIYKTRDSAIRVFLVD